MEHRPEAEEPERRHWDGWTFEERRDESEPSLGGTLDTPAHESTELAPAHRVAWWIAVGLTLYALINGALWAFDVIGWRRTVAGLSSVLLLAGVAMLYWRLSPGEATHLWRREVRESQHTELTPEGLAENFRLFWTFVGGVLIALASVGLIFAIRGG
jgi:hypothetical protein